MWRGSVSLGNIQCNECHRTIQYLERYLIIDEKDSEKGKKGGTLYYCIDCCLKKGYARYRDEKGEQILTFFPEPTVGL